MTALASVPHIGFIVAAYAVTGAVAVGLVAAVLLDGRALRRTLARLEARAGRGRAPGNGRATGGSRAGGSR